MFAMFPKPLLMAASMPPFEGACADILSAPRAAHDVPHQRETWHLPLTLKTKFNLHIGNRNVAKNYFGMWDYT